MGIELQKENTKKKNKAIGDDQHAIFRKLKDKICKKTEMIQLGLKAESF
jgi:hypothetical protein